MNRLPVQKAVPIVLLMIVLVVVLSGCSALETLSSLRARFNNDSSQVDQSLEANPEVAIPEIDQSEIAGETGETKDVTLYFADSQGQSLVAERRTIPKTIGIARATINELIAGPHPESGLLPTIPQGTMLQDINVKENGLVIVDFSQELVDNHAGGNLAETLTVYSIVNTLTQFPTVDRVQFLVEGKYLDSLAGSVDVSGEIYQDSSLVWGGSIIQ